MPWKEWSVMDERREFMVAWDRGEESLAELCRQYGVSRPTAYKWIERYAAEGQAGLAERSRAPRRCWQAMEASIAEQIVGARERHPRWGPRKLRAYLAAKDPQTHWPAASSIGELLSRKGLVQRRRVRRRTPAYTQPLAHAGEPNQVWCADFKGWFLCGNGERCDPLTISDSYSRYLLRCRCVEKSDGPHVRAIFETVFGECGLPVAIRTDNGPPFASPAPAGLSRLSMWWLRLGIRHERIEPGCPEQNGRHERLHQTLQQETADPPAANLRRQQERFRDFEREYNQQRPHEALGNRTPASVYVLSARPYPARLPELAYPPGVQFRLISHNGYLSWKRDRVFVSEVLAREQVGLLEGEQEVYEVYYGPLLLGWFDSSERVFVADRGPGRRRV